MDTAPEVQFLETILKALVEQPDMVNVEKTSDEQGVLLSVTVAPGDMGKIIGKEGATAKAIRTLLRAIGMRVKARVNMKILEPEGSTRKEAPLKEIDEALDNL